MSCSRPAELPTLEQIGQLVKRAKRKSLVCVQLETRHDLLSFCEQKFLPEPSTCQLIQTNPQSSEVVDLLNGDYYVIPQALKCSTGMLLLRIVVDDPALFYV